MLYTPNLQPSKGEPLKIDLRSCKKRKRKKKQRKEKEPAQKDRARRKYRKAEQKSSTIQDSMRKTICPTEKKYPEEQSEKRKRGRVARLEAVNGR